MTDSVPARGEEPEPAPAGETADAGDLAPRSQPPADPPVLHARRRLAKLSMRELSHAIESALIDTDPDPADLPVVIALFQQPRYFEVERRRFRALARNTLVTIVGFVDDDPDVPSPIVGVAMQPGEPLTREWVLLVVSKGICAAVVGEDESDVTTPEAERTFTARWGLDRELTVAETRRLLDLLGDRMPSDVIEQVRTRLAEAEAARPRQIEARLASSIERLVDAIEQASRRTTRRSSAPESAPPGVNERDPVTGIPNRAHLARYLGQRILDPTTAPRFAVAWVDVDHLEQVNETHGRPAGDAVLRAVADTITGLLRQEDCAARWGGDEFVVVFDQTEIGTAKRRAEEIAHAVATLQLPRPYETVRTSVSVAVGLADLPRLGLRQLGELVSGRRAAGAPIVGDYLVQD